MSSFMIQGLFVGVLLGGSILGSQSSKHASEVLKQQHKAEQKKWPKPLKRSKSLPNIVFESEPLSDEDPAVQKILHDILNGKVLSYTSWKKNIVIPDGREIDQEMYWDFVLEAYNHQDLRTLKWLNKKKVDCPISMLLTADLYAKVGPSQTNIVLLDGEK